MVDNMATLYGLIFDVDGVIADTEAVNARASIAMFAEMFGLPGVVRADFEKGLGRGAAEYVRAAATIHGLELTDEEVAAATEMRQQKFLEMLRQDPLPPFDGVLDLMGQALAHPIFRVAIATSGTREKSQAVLDSAGIPWQQMTYITGSDVRNKKPHPELFLTAARHAGLLPGRCVVIEDAPDGVAAAKAAGARCIAVTNSTTPEKLAASDRIISTLTEIDINSVIQLIENADHQE